MKEIELGDKVKCKYTGYTGVAVARTEFINGCVQYSIAAKVGKDNKLPDGEISLDEDSLIVVSKRREKSVKKDTGGARRTAPKLRGY